MYETRYHRAGSIDEAVKLMGEADNGKFIAGGQTLLPTMKQRLAAPDLLIDLRHIGDLKGISVDGNKVRIGGGTTHYEVEFSPELQATFATLAELAGSIGDPHVRHMGTIGGSIANNDPTADYPAAMLALDATIHTTSRDLQAGDFFLGMFETALEEDEIVTAVSFTVPEKSGYAKFRNPASHYAMAGVFVSKDANTVRVAVTGAGMDGVYRWSEAEEALASNFSADALDGLEVDAGEMTEDIHGSAEYRANLVEVMAKRAVADAV